MGSEKQTQKTKPGSQERKDIAEKVFEGMRSGLSAFKACQKIGIHQSRFNQWLNADPEMASEYARAREDLIERIANEIIELSDSDVDVLPDGKKDWAAIQKHKLQVDTRRWLLSKMAPKKYGDKMTIAGDGDAPLKVEQTIDASKISTSALAEIIAARDATNGS